MKDLIPFQFDEKPVRIITDEGGNPWFVAKDVCDVLGIENVSKAISALDDDEKNTLTISKGIAGNPNQNIINEPGLYSLILRSRKAEAKRFKRWVTHEVLPSIRKTGSYSITDPVQALNDPATMRQLLLNYTEKVLALEETVKQQAPKVEALDRIADADGATCVTNAAKALQMRPKDLFGWLSANRWIYRRRGGREWLGYQDKVQQGVLTHKVVSVELGDGREMIRESVLITPKGLARLAMVANAHGASRAYRGAVC